jgi:hypothetical protein
MKVQKKIWVALFCFAISSAVIVTACKKEDSAASVPPGTQKISLYLNDGPLPNISKVLIDI